MSSRPTHHSYPIVAPDPVALAQAVREAARRLGLVDVAFTDLRADEAGKTALDRWLGQNFHGEMAYLEQPPRHDPRPLAPDAKTLISVAMRYERRSRDEHSRAWGSAAEIATYAWGADYHTVLWDKLEVLADGICQLVGRDVRPRICVDTSPLLERSTARRAGLGFVGKSTMLIIPGAGSDFVLGELFVDVALPSGAPPPDRCGACTACLDACPTRAFVGPYVLDARRCISYLTIELRGPIPRELRPLVGTHLFGCDVCQEVCPFNRSVKARSVDSLLDARPTQCSPDPTAWLGLTSTGYRKLVRGTALRRAGRAQLQRNAAVVLGNLREPRHVPVLATALLREKSPLVRQHVAWALGQIGDKAARTALREAAALETSPAVREEIDEALTQSSSSTTTGA